VNSEKQLKMICASILSDLDGSKIAVMCYSLESFKNLLSKYIDVCKVSNIEKSIMILKENWFLKVTDGFNSLSLKNLLKIPHPRIK
jgi:hypothetical protein